MRPITKVGHEIMRGIKLLDFRNWEYTKPLGSNVKGFGKKSFEYKLWDQNFFKITCSKLVNRTSNFNINSIRDASKFQELETVPKHLSQMSCNLCTQSF